MKSLIENKLKARNTEQLKKDIIEAMNSDDKGSTLIFTFALNVLEERLSEEEYIAFEESL